MTRLVPDTLVMAERNLVRLPRAPDLLIAFTIQPVMFVLLFAYVFGGAIATPGYDDYIEFLIPGIIVQNIAFGGFVTALGLAEDMQKGLIDRFRSLPTARASVLAGRTLADVATNALSIRIDHPWPPRAPAPATRSISRPRSTGGTGYRGIGDGHRLRQSEGERTTARNESSSLVNGSRMASPGNARISSNVRRTSAGGPSGTEA